MRLAFIFFPGDAKKTTCPGLVLGMKRGKYIGKWLRKSELTLDVLTPSSYRRSIIIITISIDFSVF
jgi:hypothetical protein